MIHAKNGISFVGAYGADDAEWQVTQAEWQVMEDRWAASNRKLHELARVSTPS